MSVMTKLLECPKTLSGKEGAQERIESLWDLYLTWRSKDVQPSQRTFVPEGPASGFLLLREIESTALDVLQTYLSEQIPCEFVLALMKSTANTTSRFMLATPTHADEYWKLGFEMFWNGVAALGISDEEGHRRANGNWGPLSSSRR